MDTSTQVYELQKQSIMTQKPQSINNNEYLLLLKHQSDCQINKSEIDQLLKLFKKYDSSKQAKLNFHDILNLLQDHGIIIDQQCKEKIFKEIEDRNTVKLDFQTLLYITRVCKDYHKMKENVQQEVQQSEYLDAFVALGGDPNGDGYINKNKLIDILSEEFDLAFDIEDLLEQLEVQSDLLDFDQFKRLFRSDQRTLKKTSSILSLISTRSLVSQRSTSSIPTVKVRMRDFEKFCKKWDEDEVSQYSPLKKR